MATGDAETFDLRDLDAGEVFEADVRVFHRAGLDGAHHLEEGLRFIIDPHGDDGPDGERRTLLLTQETLDERGAMVRSTCDMLTVEGADPLDHSAVAAVRRLEGD